MEKIRCKTMCIAAWYDEKIDEFINEYLGKYEVLKIIKTPFETNDPYISVSIIYKEYIEDIDFIKHLLKESLKLDTISINCVQSNLNIGFNRASRIVAILENEGIISDKKAGRKLLITQEEAEKIIDNIKEF